jgi:hypothetical protein
MMKVSKVCNVVFAGLLALSILPLASVSSAEAKSKRYEAGASTQQEQSQRNTGINRVLSPNLSCGSDERNNNVTKGAAYGAGAGLLTGGGLIGGAVGAGAGALIQQEQNRDACRGNRKR